MWRPTTYWYVLCNYLWALGQAEELMKDKTDCFVLIYSLSTKYKTSCMIYEALFFKTKILGFLFKSYWEFKYLIVSTKPSGRLFWAWGSGKLQIYVAIRLAQAWGRVRCMNGYKHPEKPEEYSGTSSGDRAKEARNSIPLQDSLPLLCHQWASEISVSHFLSFSATQWPSSVVRMSVF